MAYADRLNYVDLAVLDAVLKSGSFEGAAMALNVTQSAISQKIAKLEDQFGHILVLRGKPCSGTMIAKILCSTYSQVVQLENETKRLIKAEINNIPSLTLSINADSLATWFPDVLIEAAKHLGATLEIVSEDQDHSIRLLSDLDASAVITAIPRPLTGCVSSNIGGMEYAAVASPEFMKRLRNPFESANEYQSIPCLHYDRLDSLPLRWLSSVFSEFDQTKSDWCTNYYLPSYQGYLKALKGSVGWGMMPTLTVKRHLVSGELVELIPGKTIVLPLYWQTAKTCGAIVNELSVIVKKQAKKHLLAPAEV